MSIATIIQRQERKISQREIDRMRTDEIVQMFQDYVLSQASELNKYFPTVIIGDCSYGNIVGISNSRVNYIGDSTYNITKSSTKNHFNVGYSANSASGGKKFEFRLDMNNVQLRKVFKCTLEYLVSISYYGYKEYNFEHVVYHGRKRII